MGRATLIDHLQRVNVAANWDTRIIILGSSILSG